MAYIGSKPADKALTSDDITDGVISTAKIQDNAVTSAKTSYSDAPFRNIIINGDMSIAQRGTSSTGITSAGYRSLDRIYHNIATAGTWTISQDTDVPSGQGFSSSLKMDCTTANASLSAGSINILEQRIEGQNLQYLKKGTSSAESLTLSFWVKSNKTGTYTTEQYDFDNTRQISKTFTINSADTWEKKTITFAGDTTGTLDNDNGLSFALSIWLGAGSNHTSGTLNTSWNTSTTANRVSSSNVNLADSTSNYINITGVQLEAGTVASDFEFLPYDLNLQRCLRYYQKSYSYATAAGTNTLVGIRTTGGSAGSLTTGYIYGDIQLKVSMRTAPTITTYDKAGNSGVCSRLNGGVSRTDSQNASADVPSEKSFTIQSTGTANAGAIDVHFEATAEL